MKNQQGGGGEHQKGFCIIVIMSCWHQTPYDRDRMWQAIFDRQRFCVANAASVLQAADSYQVLSLRATTIDFMVSNFGAVVQSEAFKDLVKLESRGLVLRFLEEASVRLQPRED